MTVAKVIQIAITISVMLIVCSLGLRTTLQKAGYLFRQPKLLVRSLLAMYIVMPIAAAILVYFLSLPPAVEITFVALAVSPVPPMLPRKVQAAGESRSYMLGLLTAAAITSILFVPAAIEIFEQILNWPARTPISSIAFIVTTSIIVPLGVGLTLRQIWPEVAERLAEPLSRAATVLLIICVLPVQFTQGAAEVSLIGDGTVLAISVFIIVGFVVGGLLAGSKLSDRTVLSLSTASRHPGVALAIGSASFPNQKLILPAILLYLAVNAVLSWAFLKWIRFKNKERLSGGQQSAA